MYETLPVLHVIQFTHVHTNVKVKHACIHIDWVTRGFVSTRKITLISPTDTSDKSSTCVGEEGMDIGEVDLIVCFDAHKSPVKLIQWMGRTGRKRIVVIVAVYSRTLSEEHSGTLF